MDFEDADYFVLKNRRGHRTVSVVVVLLIAFVEFAGPGQSNPEGAATLIYPLAAIWFADELADRSSVVEWFRSRTKALIFRWAGWFGLGYFAFLSGSRFWT
ncbi:hypothetical protein [Luteolibacter soli]|uniref:Uncharacterized protein n=1 Tax=Luteolibacter soli TaxID=3135280 RepID=A0ABU9B248_9BACT